jgi:hypothetical protein
MKAWMITKVLSWLGCHHQSEHGKSARESYCPVIDVLPKATNEN